MWNSTFCPGKKVLKTESWKFWKWAFDYKITPPAGFFESTQPPYIVIPTASKGLVMVYAQVKEEPKEKKDEK